MIIPKEIKKASCSGKCGLVTTDKCSWCGKTWVNGIEVDLKKDMPLEYRDYQIEFADSASRMRFQYIHKEYNGPEDHRLGVKNSLAECIRQIDEDMNEYRAELLDKAYNSVGYKYTTDPIILNDRWNALYKLTNDELWDLIQKKKKSISPS